jgi:hypothetical protein
MRKYGLNNLASRPALLSKQLILAQSSVADNRHRRLMDELGITLARSSLAESAFRDYYSNW